MRKIKHIVLFLFLSTLLEIFFPQYGAASSLRAGSPAGAGRAAAQTAKT
jgi:hypothetical protein